MSCIIFGYRRFYAIICKITHFFLSQAQKSSTICALHPPQGKKCAMHHVTNMRSVRISASGGDNDRRRWR